jgi:hypothetical protein
MNIKNRQQFLVICVGILVAVWAGNLLIYGPMVKWWQSRQAQVKQLRQEVSQGKSLIRREAYIRSEWASMSTNSLPNNSSQAEQEVLTAFDNWAGNTSANVTSITPQWQQEEDDYATLDCRVEASGDIGTLSRFLYEVENSPMALQVASLDLTSTDDRGQVLSLGLEVNGLALISPKP